MSFAIAVYVFLFAAGLFFFGLFGVLSKIDKKLRDKP